MEIGSVEDFEILVPIYGAIRYLENVDYLRKYGARVLLCTTTSESSDFDSALEQLAATNGFRIFRGEVDRHVGAGRRATDGGVRDKIVRDAVLSVEAKYVVCLDADTTTARPLGELIGAMVASKYDLVSIRLVPSNRNSVLARMQAHEYRMAMSIRRLMPWMVSGACHASRTNVHQEVMRRHSLFFQGNDIEVGLIAQQLGFQVGHIPFEVATTVPATLGAWFGQRFAWAGGEVRLFLANPQVALKHPFIWFYGALLVIGLAPLRWDSLVHPGPALAIVLIIYFALTVYANREHRDRYLLLLPVYFACVSLVLAPLGIVSYTRMVLADRNFGFIRVGSGRGRALPIRDPGGRPKGSVLGG